MVNDSDWQVKYGSDPWVKLIYGCKTESIVYCALGPMFVGAEITLAPIPEYAFGSLVI